MPAPTTSKTLHKWTISRSGAGMVVHGINIETNAEDKITGVTPITPPTDPSLRELRVTDKDGVEHRLLFTY